MGEPTPVLVLCNGAIAASPGNGRAQRELRLEYREGTPCEPNVRLSLPDFVRGVYHLPDRILDLLEIAAYVFAADRSIGRGARDDLEYHAWSRRFQLVVKVRDASFWDTPKTRKLLEAALAFVTGDQEYSFEFQPGHLTPPTGLFDNEQFRLDIGGPMAVMLFSGGLDSLAGALQHLTETQNHLCLVSHRSGQPSTARTQDALAGALVERYGSRVLHYRFRAGMRGERAEEETQRTRPFLYTAIAFAMTHAMAAPGFFIHENGVTALNLPKREGVYNARASRTVHPKTIALLRDFYTHVAGRPVGIETPFSWTTKSEVFQILGECGGLDLVTSTVSCSRTFQNMADATHCGGCTQCIDRKFGAYAAGMADVDEGGIYQTDFIRNAIADGAVRTNVVDYVRQAKNLATGGIDAFYRANLRELADIVDHLGMADEEEAVHAVWSLCQRHGIQVLKALRAMREAHDDPFKPLPEGCLLKLVSEREYLKEPVQRLVESISRRLSAAVPLAFQHDLPKNENDFNDKVSALLEGDREHYEREHPAVLFALAHAVPDHSAPYRDLFIESKYLRGHTTPSKASDGIAADLTKYPGNVHVLFIVYDPLGSINDPRRFKSDFEGKGRCTICVIR